MTIQAQWNKEIFGRLPNALRTLESFEISCGIKTEEKETSKGVKTTIVKGLDTETINISYNAGFVVGTDPRQEFENFKKIADTGKSDNFYLGSTNVGHTKFMLDQVDLSNVVYGPDGRFYSGTIGLSFGDDRNQEKAKSKSKSKAKKSSSGGKSGLTYSAKDIEDAKKLADG